MTQFEAILGVLLMIASFLVGYYAGWKDGRKRQKLMEVKIEK